MAGRCDSVRLKLEPLLSKGSLAAAGYGNAAATASTLRVRPSEANRRRKAKEARTGQGMHPPRNLSAFSAGSC